MRSCVNSVNAVKTSASAIRVNESLLNVVLHDQLFEQKAISAALLVTPTGPSKSAQRIAKVVNTIKQAPKKPT